MTRALVLMLDSLGVGASADANRFGDVGADTFGHIAESAANGAANREGLRQGPLAIQIWRHWGSCTLRPKVAGRGLRDSPRKRPVGHGDMRWSEVRARIRRAGIGKWRVFRCCLNGVISHFLSHAFRRS